MNTTPVLCLQVNEEIQLRLLEERHAEEYFALIERNHDYLQEWIAVEAYEGSVEHLRAYVKQRLLHFVEGSGYHLGIWYQEGILRQVVRLGDRYVDGVFYGLLVDEWRTRAELPQESSSAHDQQ